VTDTWTGPHCVCTASPSSVFEDELEDPDESLLDPDPELPDESDDPESAVPACATTDDSLPSGTRLLVEVW
jgi:hypothetical protein